MALSTHLLALLALALSSSALPRVEPETAPAPVARATVCNGFAELCDRAYDNVTFVGAHDSYAIDTSALDLSSNQEVSITDQLNLGARMMQAQMHWETDHLELCHTSCFLYDGGSLLSWLQEIKTWMDANPTEVISILLVNSDDRPPTDIAADFVSAGLDALAYAPPSVPVLLGGWPTLGSLIDSGKRLVVFIDASADESQVPYLLQEFNMVWESPYDVTDNTFPCNVDRIGGDNNQATHMYLINHYLDNEFIGIDIPDRSDAATTNSAAGAGNLLVNAQTCAGTYGRYPNFLLLDFVDKGTPAPVAAFLNGLAASP